MATVFGVVLLATAALGLAYTLKAFVGTWLRWRGTRVVTCPETQRPAAVTVDASLAATAAFEAHPELRLESCTRWPERQGCGQECLAQIEAAPDGCLVHSILVHWYAGKPCVFCGKTFADVRWHDHKPALLSPEARLVEWSSVAPQAVPEVLRTHKPVCWNCFVAEAFRREHPELVVERPRKSA